MVFNPGPSDPFFTAMKPPVDETPAQKTARVKRERDAQKNSDEIDERIKQERAAMKKERGVIKVLLLGQSESGKSTTLKNFRMRYAPSDWEKERDGWCYVILLNIVRSITTILRVVEAELNGDTPADSEDDSTLRGDEGIKFTDRHQRLMVRLAPLLGVEAELKRRLGAGTEDVLPTTAPMAATPFDQPEEGEITRRRIAEFSVRSWPDVLENPHRPSSESTADSNSATTIIASCREDMKSLWNDKVVKLALKRRRLQLHDSAGFFLNDLDRIATRNYRVTDEDIVRARLRTVGIQEYCLVFKHGPWDTPKSSKDNTWEWRIFDVGGCRTLRKAWLPYFDNVNVIIFLCPISVFDQRLEEDYSIYRLEDSIILWTSICASKLLAKTQLILFLNKCDLLRAKLKKGIRINRFLPSYGDRPNEVIPAVKYFREKFKDIQKQHSPEHRSTYIYPTTVTDTEATGMTLESVRDGVLRENLAASQLI